MSRGGCSRPESKL
eukprot:gene12321-biopygen3363